MLLSLRAPGCQIGDFAAAVTTGHEKNRNDVAMNPAAALPDTPLPSAIRSRFVEGINGLRIHVLESGFETRGRPCLLLLHGFPELAYSWRKVMPQLAAGRS